MQSAPGRGRGLDLWVLVDRSPSARELLEPKLEEMEALLERSQSSSDRLFFVDFAGDVRRRSDSESEVVQELGDTTDLATALQFTLSSMDPERNGRILVLSDGYGTAPMSGVAEP